MAMLQRAAERPVHAYLLVGPRGSGIEVAARCFAALLIGADGDERVVCGVVIPTSSSSGPSRRCTPSSATCARRSFPAVHASPIETERKVRDAARGGPAQPGVVEHAAEEHRGASAAHDRHPRRRVRRELLDTIRSRCQQIDFGALGTEVLASELERRGVARGARAPGARHSRAGSLDRAVALDRAPRRAARRVRRRPGARRRHGRDGADAGRGPRRGHQGHAGRARGRAARPSSRSSTPRSSARQYADATASGCASGSTDRQKREARRARIDALARRDHRDRVGVPRRARRRPSPALNARPAPRSSVAPRRGGRARRLPRGSRGVLIQPRRALLLVAPAAAPAGRGRRP